MDAARWCFVLICHTLLTEREQSESWRNEKKNKKGCLLIAKVSTLLPQTDFHCLNRALLVLHHLLSVPFLSEWLRWCCYCNTLQSRMHTGKYRHNTPQIAKLGFH